MGKEQTSRNETNIPKQVKTQTNNIVIQEVTENTITLNVNGELRKMPYTIDTVAQLWADLQKAPSKTFQIGDKIYNIGNINEANFGTILNSVKNAATHSNITAGGNVHIGDIITNNYTDPNLSTTELVILPNVNVNAIKTAYKKANWAEVIRLLDGYFGDNPTHQYSQLKQTIEHYLSQGLMPTPAALQGLEMLINQLKTTK